MQSKIFKKGFLVLINYVLSTHAGKLYRQTVQKKTMASHVVLVAAVAAAVLASLVPGVPAPSVVWKGKKRALLLERPAWKLLGLTGMTGGAL